MGFLRRLKMRLEPQSYLLRQPREVIHLAGDGGVPTVTLADVGRGANLFWRFYSRPDMMLICHLTDDEAEVVVDTPPEVGLLERVRGQMKNRHAFLLDLDEDGLGHLEFFTIPRWDSEGTFVDAMFTTLNDSRAGRVPMEEAFKHVASGRVALGA